MSRNRNRNTSVVVHKHEQKRDGLSIFADCLSIASSVTKIAAAVSEVNSRREPVFSGYEPPVVIERPVYVPVPVEPPVYSYEAELLAAARRAELRAERHASLQTAVDMITGRSPLSSAVASSPTVVEREVKTSSDLFGNKTVTETITTHQSWCMCRPCRWARLGIKR